MSVRTLKEMHVIDENGIQDGSCLWREVTGWTGGVSCVDRLIYGGVLWAHRYYISYLNLFCNKLIKKRKGINKIN